METFLEYETIYREPPPGHVFMEVWQKSIQGKWQKWCVVHASDKKQRLCDPFLALSPKPVARFRWKRARLCLFRPQPHLPSFIQIYSSFRDLLAKTTLQIVTIIGDPILPSEIGSPIIILMIRDRGTYIQQNSVPL